MQKIIYYEHISHIFLRKCKLFGLVCPNKFPIGTKNREIPLCHREILHPNLLLSWLPPKITTRF